MNESEHTTVTVSGSTSLSYSFEKSLMCECGLIKVRGGEGGTGKVIRAFEWVYM